jgi:hypothetical protein
MKKLILIGLITTAFGGAARAQNKFNAADFKANLGKTGTLCDTVYSLKIVSDSLTLLNMGGAYPHQKYTIAVKGNKITLDFLILNARLFALPAFSKSLKINQKW